MTDILQEIVADKRIEVARQKEAIPLSALLALRGDGVLGYNTLSMRDYLLRNKSSGIIAEFKRKSPSKGWLHPKADVGGTVYNYGKKEAAACSVLTDSKYFGGSLSDLQIARECTCTRTAYNFKDSYSSLYRRPLLRKDFIIDVYQLYQSRWLGADAILLIAAILTPEECLMLAETAHILGLEVLLEIHNEGELNHLNPYIDMLGVNNRNLGTFHTDIDNSFRLVEQIQAFLEKSGDVSPLLVAESGISTPQEVARLRKAGFRGFLIGETFMKEDDPDEALACFIQELEKLQKLEASQQ
ncbi:Indole-3-glycerol phosphate synthase [Bacteroidales bacterium Barb6XT]|nr:Indole-3-glycerol phosphate synthase [Bacteroidales bacterium Barb6XT]